MKYQANSLSNFFERQASNVFGYPSSSQLMYRLDIILLRVHLPTLRRVHVSEQDNKCLFDKCEVINATVMETSTAATSTPDSDGEDERGDGW